MIDFDLLYLGDADIQASPSQTCLPGHAPTPACKFLLLLQVSLLGVAAGVRDVKLEGRARMVLAPTLAQVERGTPSPAPSDHPSTPD